MSQAIKSLQGKKTRFPAISSSKLRRKGKLLVVSKQGVEVDVVKAIEDTRRNLRYGLRRRGERVDAALACGHEFSPTPKAEPAPFPTSLRSPNLPPARHA